jgi:lipase chaperone LimK
VMVTGAPVVMPAGIVTPSSSSGVPLVSSPNLITHEAPQA